MILAAALLCLPTPAPMIGGVVGAVQDLPGRDASEDPARVALLLAERCGRCHGEGSDDRKALRDWSLAHDLASTAADPVLVVPGDAEASDLFLVCDDGDMPPADEPEAPLSQDELALLASWIDGGALPPAQQAEQGADPESDPTTTPPVVARTRGARSGFALLGRFHIVLLHFPVVLVLLAALGSLRKGGPLAITRLHAGLAVPASILAAATGWVLENEVSGDLELHRWLGVGTAVGACVTSWLIQRAHHRGAGPWRLALWATTLLMLSAAHGGGEHVHGEGWLSLSAPEEAPSSEPTP